MLLDQGPKLQHHRRMNPKGISVCAHYLHLHLLCRYSPHISKLQFMSWLGVTDFTFKSIFSCSLENTFFQLLLAYSPLIFKTIQFCLLFKLMDGYIAINLLLVSHKGIVDIILSTISNLHICSLSLSKSATISYIC